MIQISLIINNMSREVIFFVLKSVNVEAKKSRIGSINPAVLSHTLMIEETFPVSNVIGISFDSHKT